MNLAKTLSYNYVFRGLPASTICGIAALADVRELSGGETLVRQFDKGEEIYILLEGQAITRTFSGETVAQFGPGSIVGEMALIDGQARSATVMTSGKCKVAKISAEVIRSMMEMDATVSSVIYSNLAKVLCRRLRTMNDHAENKRPSLAGVA